MLFFRRDDKTLHFTDPNGTLTSVNYPNDYPPSTNQLYKIRVPDKNRIRIIVDDFQTEAKDDTLRIVEGPFVDLNRGRPLAWLVLQLFAFTLWKYPLTFTVLNKHKKIFTIMKPEIYAHENFC